MVIRSQPACVQVAQGFGDFLAGFAHAEDEVGLGDHAQVPALGDDVEGAFVAERGADALEDPGDGFDVVGEDLGFGVADRRDVVGVAGEVGDEEFDAGAGVQFVDLADGFGVEPDAFVCEVVAGHAGDGGVAQLHGLDGAGHFGGFEPVHGGGFAGVDLAEVAAAGAFGAADEEGGFLVFPAFEDVGAAGFFADGVQAFFFDQVLELDEFRAHLDFGLDPFRFAFHRDSRVALLDPQQLPAFGCQCHSRAPSGLETSASSCLRNSSTKRSAMSAGRMSFPVSRDMVVTPASVMPQAMICP